jgi:hypothetical protein
MKELHISSTPTSSPVAGTLPFSLLSREGVLNYRRELFASNIVEKCGASLKAGTMVLRGAARHSQFIHDFWTHEETMRIISDAVETPLEIIMPLEIGHTNVQTKGDTMEAMKAELKPEPSLETVELSEADKLYNPLDEDSIIPWQ